MAIMREPDDPAGRGSGCPVDEDFDPLAAEFLADPYTVMARLPRRQEARLLRPVDRLLRRHQLRRIQQVFGDPKRTPPRWPRRRSPR
jgi:hypothetical protein